MKSYEITARKEKGAEEHTVNLDLPETTQEAISVYGEGVTFSRFLSALIVDAQAYMRGQMNKENPIFGRALQTALTEWKPGVRNVGPGRIETLKARLAKLSPEERAALFAGLTASQASDNVTNESRPQTQPKAAAAGTRR